MHIQQHVEDGSVRGTMAIHRCIYSITVEEGSVRGTMEIHRCIYSNT